MSYLIPHSTLDTCSISAKHLAEALGVATGALQESFGEHLTATEAIKRSSSFSPRSKVTLQEAVKAGGKVCTVTR